MTDGGFAAETAVMELLVLTLLLAISFQIFYAWRLPHNKDRVRTLQLWTGPSTFLGCLISVFLYMDARCHFHINNPTSLGIYYVSLVSLVIPGAANWLRITYDAACLFARARVFFKIPDISIPVLAIVNFIVCATGYAIAAQKNQARFLIIVAIWLVLIGSFALIGVIVIVLVLLKSYRDSKTISKDKEVMLRKLALLGVLDFIFVGAATGLVYFFRNALETPYSQVCNASNPEMTFRDVLHIYRQFTFSVNFLVLFGLCMGLVLAWLPFKDTAQINKAETGGQGSN
jgi:hypothetical protein